MAKKIISDEKKEDELISYLHKLVKRGIKAEKQYDSSNEPPENYNTITSNALKAATELTKVYGYGKDLEDAIGVTTNITFQVD